MTTREEADQNLAKAIADHAEAYELAYDDEMLMTYACVSAWAKVEADGSTRYNMHFRSAEVPMHEAAGLLKVAAELIWESDE